MGAEAMRFDMAPKLSKTDFEGTLP